MLVISLLVALTLTQTSPAADQTGRVSGRITAEGADTPIAGVRIMLMPTARPTGPMGMPPQALTDSDGRYVIDRLAPGPYRLSAQKTGFAPIGDLDRAPTVRIAAGQTLAFDVRLQRGAVIAGRVVDSHGEPLTDVRITVLRRMNAPAARGGQTRLFPAPGQSQQTNDLGEYRVAGLAPGEYFVAAVPQPAMMFSRAGATATRSPQAARTTLTTTYYPGTSDQAAAQPIAVAAAAEVANISFTMQSAPAFHVSGTVVDENGTPVAGAMVTLTGDPRGAGMFIGPVANTRTLDNGRFDLDDVVAGTYRAHASVPVMMTGPGRASAGVGGGVSGGTTSGSYVSFSSGASTGATEQPTEVVVNDADVKGVRMIVRRPVPQ
jgi:protocatechuate 3,4-dioxygenase beta subunit